MPQHKGEDYKIQKEDKDYNNIDKTTQKDYNNINDNGDKTI